MMPATLSSKKDKNYLQLWHAYGTIGKNIILANLCRIFRSWQIGRMDTFHPMALAATSPDLWMCAIHNQRKIRTYECSIDLTFFWHVQKPIKHMQFICSLCSNTPQTCSNSFKTFNFSEFPFLHLSLVLLCTYNFFSELCTWQSKPVFSLLFIVSCQRAIALLTG